jgi:hypothetical protein
VTIVGYSTHAFPEWGDIDPVTTADSHRDFVYVTDRTLMDIFGEFQEVHRPERDATRYAKSRAVYAAIAIANRTEARTFGEMGTLVSDKCERLADERGVADTEITPRHVALAAYAETVTSLDWMADECDLDADQLCLLHDNLRDLQKRGKEIAGEA